MRIERMLGNVSTYTDLLHAKAELTACELAPAVDAALDRLRSELNGDLSSAYVPEVELDPDMPRVHVDPRHLAAMCYHLIKNGLQAMDPKRPWLRITSTTIEATSGFLAIHIENNGSRPDPAAIEALFAPFHSTTPYGTGFGLPIAKLAARKCLGSLVLEPTERGARYVLQLPLPGTLKESEYFQGS